MQILVRFALLICVLSLCSAVQAKHVMTFEDLMRVQRISDPQLSPDGKWLLAGKGDIYAFNFTLLVPLDGGPAQPIPGIKPEEVLFGWTADGQIYSFVPGSPESSIIHFKKINPHTGAHTPWRDIAISRFAGTEVSDLFFTPDGSAYAWGYRFGVIDLYTIDGAS